MHYENFRITFAYEIFRIMTKAKRIQPTESELEILQVLWDKQEATVREVHEVIEQYRDTGYTTTLKTMQIMTEKGLIARDTSMRTHVYTPRLSREEAQDHFIGKMVSGLFGGSTSRLVIGALDSEKVSEEEIREIQNFLRQFEQKSQ